MSQNHEFESKKVDRKAVCCKCSSGLSGMFSKTGFQCRNCLAIFCKKCRNQPENAMGCGPPSGAGGAAAQPAGPDPVMEFYLKYVKRNNKGEMVVRGLPEEWKMLFKDAGVKPKELKDPKTASWLIGLMNDILAGKVGDVAGGDGGAAAAADDGDDDVVRLEALFPFEPQQEGDLQFNKGDIIVLRVRFDNGWAEGEIDGRVGQFPYNYIKELPREPKKAPPPPPAARPPADAAPAENNFPPPQVDAAPAAAAPAAAAPPPPPMPVSAPKPPPPPPAAKKGPAPPPPPAGSKPDAGGGGGGGDAGGRGFSANDLASGASRLRKVEDTPSPGGKKELKDLTAAERTNMLDIISAAMNARRKDIDEEGGDDDDDGWDDEEDDW